MEERALFVMVGAGPGDPELITLKAVKALQEADVVLYDALCHRDLLNHCKRDALKISVGKRHGEHSVTQEEINELISLYAKTYRVVVRLKGGDPFVFGRAAEELEVAVKEGMDIEVIPGISSSYAAMSSQLIPLTMRTKSESFFVVTGTTAECKVSADIKEALSTTATIIILMGYHKLRYIVDIAKSCGKASLPVAVIQHATLPDEKIAIGTISTIELVCQEKQMGSPAVVVLGEVVAEREKYINRKKTLQKAIS